MTNHPLGHIEVVILVIEDVSDSLLHFGGEVVGRIESSQVFNNVLETDEAVVE
jgi:hypothetical protein